MHVEGVEERDQEGRQEADGDQGEDAEEHALDEVDAGRALPRAVDVRLDLFQLGALARHECLQFLQVDAVAVRPFDEAEHMGLDGEDPLHRNPSRRSVEPLACLDREDVAAVQEVGEGRRTRRDPVGHAVEPELRLGLTPDETAEEACGRLRLGLARGEGDGRGLPEAPVGVDDRAGGGFEVRERSLVLLERLLVDPVSSVQLLCPAMMGVDELRERGMAFGHLPGPVRVRERRHLRGSQWSRPALPAPRRESISALSAASSTGSVTWRVRERPVSSSTVIV